MVNYDKVEIKDSLTTEDLFQLIEEWGGEPEYTDFGFVASTICHNSPMEGSHKLYYYTNSGLFQCYTNCGYFDIFELVIKIANIQWGLDYDLNDAIRWVAYRFGFSGQVVDDTEKLKDWEILDNYKRINNISLASSKALELSSYEDDVLDNLNYNLILEPWLEEGISKEVLNKARIGYYPGGDQITIPHYDIEGRFIGLRGRTMSKEESERFGKYRPIKIFKTLYNHPLGLNLYGLNWCKDNLKLGKSAIIFESEKSVLKFMSWYPDSNIAVACCGSSISYTQINLLKQCNVENLIIAFDREGEKDDKNKYVEKFYKLNEKYKGYFNLSFVYDKKGEYLDYKDSPVDKTKEVFEKLLNERITL